jgi:peptidoglycan/LPS O-acetylase OafA/YrhL
MSNKKYLDILQIFRGIAALMVVIHHAIPAFKYYYHVEIPVINFIAETGKLGVDFFFVLSGFIISYSTHNKARTTKEFKHYIINRFIRIYIPYLPIGIAMYLLYLFLPEISNGDRGEMSLVRSLTLIPTGNPALSVAWTLSYEMMFYILFGLSFISKKIWNIFVCIWLLLILSFNYTSETHITSILFNTYNLEFILGYVLSLFVLKIPNTKYQIPKLFLYFAMFTFSLIFLLLHAKKNFGFYFSANIVFAITVSLLIYIGVTSKKLKINTKSIFMIIGNASYSIYLTHDVLIPIVMRFGKSTLNYLQFLFGLVVIMVLCSFAGYLYYLVFEKYFMNKLKRRIFNF